MSIAERIRLAIFFFFILLIIFGELAVIIAWIKEKRGGDIKGNQFAKPLVRALFTSLFSILALSSLYAYFIEPYWINLSRIRLETPKLKRGSKLILVQLSDIHSKGLGKNEKRIPTIVNSLKPDIICLTGDYINDINAVNAVREMVAKLKAKYGIFCVRGNWDLAIAPDTDIFQGLPVQMLEGEIRRIKAQGGTIFIVGLDIQDDISTLSHLLAFKKPGDFTLLLYHYPDLADELKGLPIDLYLCGHTHGGQIAIPSYGAILTLCKTGKKYERGLYKIGETILYVNRGIGTEGLPLRFFSPPEIAILEIVGTGK